MSSLHRKERICDLEVGSMASEIVQRRSSISQLSIKSEFVNGMLCSMASDELTRLWCCCHVGSAVCVWSGVSYVESSSCVCP